MNRLHAAKIESHISLGRGYYRLVLRAPAVARSAVPGQFVMLRVSERLDPFLARPLGIYAVSRRGVVDLVYRIVGRGTALLAQTEPGAVLPLLGPLGNSFPLPDKNAAPVLVAGGSGFPPLHFFSSHLMKKRFHPHLLVGARERSGLPPEGVIGDFRNQKAVIARATEDGSAGMHGKVSDLLIRFLEKQGTDKVVLYACGPRLMIREISRIAAERSLPCYVSMEERMACGVGACMGCSVRSSTGGFKRVCKEGPVFDARDLAW